MTTGNTLRRSGFPFLTVAMAVLQTQLVQPSLDSLHQYDVEVSNLNFQQLTFFSGYSTS
ncbi:hypothetical protein GLYMA_05G020001v4 [Glycine max]|nr:hypothetical protein GLYMA_05G020001v4 [Glycine max]KAH1132384.1 hypothetical protein GYH30_011311 [Glycine max]